MLKKLLTIVVLASMLSGTVMASDDEMERTSDTQGSARKKARVVTDAVDATLQRAQNVDNLYHQYEAISVEALCMLKRGEKRKDLSEEVKSHQQQAKDLKDLETMYNLGVCYMNGTGVNQDFAKGFELFKQAAERGHTEAMYDLGRNYEFGTGYIEMEQAMEWYQKAAERGHEGAMRRLGWVCINGRFVKKDEVKSTGWVRVRARSESDLQREADEAKKIIKIETFRCYLERARKEDKEAMNYLGWCYMLGKGIEGNADVAYVWWNKAVNLGSVEALNSLGLCYLCGIGKDLDKVQAVKYFTDAAKKGSTKAMNNLGWCFETGTGIVQDERKAVYWYQKAVSLGNVDAKGNLDSLKIRIMQ